MNSEISSKAPTWFIVVAALALAWNLMGVVAYVSHVMISPEALAALSPDERGLYEAFPPWVTGAFAVAVFAGVIGSIGLLVKKTWAMPLLAASLVAVLIQNFYWLFMSNAPNVYGSEVYFMPGAIIVIAAALVWLARFSAKKGWLS